MAYLVHPEIVEVGSVFTVRLRPIPSDGETEYTMTWPTREAADAFVDRLKAGDPFKELPPWLGPMVRLPRAAQP
jgi:hypothetical protein